jgi:hypothetical protein
VKSPWNSPGCAEGSAQQAEAPHQLRYRTACVR